jgi:hypothetical protein
VIRDHSAAHLTHLISGSPHEREGEGKQVAHSGVLCESMLACSKRRVSHEGKGNFGVFTDPPDTNLGNSLSSKVSVHRA